ncbi:hypothetical protein I6F07_00090 [Ensifer sp. IC4062]|nr:hypothetical protein [Ensifer sp. IC4062]MCA1438635.1 hypothetical protein [Ensifer sp. IC4062]
MLTVGGKYQQSEETMKALGDWSPSIPLVRAINAVNLGNIDEAKSHVKKALEIEPSLTAEGWKTSTFVDGDVVDRQVSDLTKAGLPEK